VSGDAISTNASAGSAGGLLTGTVIRRAGVLEVRAGARTWACTLAGALRHTARDNDEAVAVGDAVCFTACGHDRGVVTRILPRRNAFRRRAAGRKPRPQTIAANVDQVLIVVAVEQPRIRLGLLDRLLIDAEHAEIPATICITKADLDPSGDLGSPLRGYIPLGYPVHTTSVLRGIGIDALRAAMAGRTSVLVGASGAGKSSLLNALEPGLGLRVGQISHSTGKGRHTTSDQQMHELAGGYVIDTPGMREFGLWQIAPGDLARCFPEMRPHLGRCRFGDCTHVHEPHCAVRQAVQQGVIDARRYQSYRRMLGGEAIEEQTSHDADSQRQASADRAAPVLTCVHCGQAVPMKAMGTAHRNHCPHCLHSVHVDCSPGDRGAGCGGIMEPISVWARDGDEWAIIHRCRGCGVIHSNRAAGDDDEQALVALAARALSHSPFPQDHLRELIASV
jgi:ribosome biogenesis GTPase